MHRHRGLSRVRARGRALASAAALVLFAGLPATGAAVAPRLAVGDALVTTTTLRADGRTTVATTLGGASSPVEFGGADGEVARADASVPSPHVAGRLIVRFRSGTSLLEGSGPARVLVPGSNVHLVRTPPGMSVAAAIARYRSDPNVVYAEPDGIVSAVAVPGGYDPVKQWDMERIAAPAAWDLHTDSGPVVVAVVDTGIDYAHPDLAGNLWSDASGTVHGYTCSGGACVPGGLDDHGHGTHVAGTIGAVGDDGTGIAGVNWKVQLLSVKFLNASGSGAISDAVAGFELLRQLKVSGVNLRVTNNSWGGGGPSQALQDAMLALETTAGAPSTLHVCAAGNSGVDADVTPMYPAAYPNRGIVSVLATDAADAGAWFTNHGYTSVDLAAPGVDIWSTVPTGTCSLCDPSGYRSLSGTSMAAPHVAGVAAAMLARHPELGAAQARDALLRPASYDAVTNAKGARSSTGGRLNFAKVLANAGFYANPVLNRFPTVTAGPDVVASAGAIVAFSQTADDPDGDPLRTSTGRGPLSASGGWQVEWMARQRLPLSASTPFAAPDLARVVAVPYDTAASDGRGGGAAARSWLVVEPVATPGGSPIGTLTLPATAEVGVAVTVGFAASDPEGGIVAWDLYVAHLNGNSGICCYTGSSASVTFRSGGAYRVFVRAIDRELNLSAVGTGTITVGAGAGSPAIPDVKLSAASGPAPFTVGVDMSGSSDADGAIVTYFVGCGGGYAAGQKSPYGSCTFTQPGTYALLMHVHDASGFLSPYTAYVTVMPPGPTPPPPPPDTTPPTVEFASPAAGATVSGSVRLSATAADAGSGVASVDYYLGSVSAATAIGSATAAPYAVTWNAASAPPGPHRLIAVAHDAAGNASAPAAVDITVPAVLPVVTLSPAGTITVARKARLDLSATTNAPSYGIVRVEFLLGSTIVCADTVAPYTCRWTAPGATRSNLQFRARAVDGRGNAGLSAILVVNVR